MCDAAWMGVDCSLMNLMPANVHPAYPSPAIFNSTTSWGGSVSLGDDERYHMFAAEMANGCGLNSWGTNSIIVHSVSATPEGPFERREVVVDAFAHNPTVSRAPDGTWVLYHIGCGTPNKYPKCDKCSGGRTGGCPGAHEQVACTKNTTHLMYSSDLNGPWNALNSTILNPNGNFNIDNPSPVFFPNGTVLMLGRGSSSSNVRTITAPSWQGPYTLGPLLNLHAPIEDPFLYRDVRGNFHSLFHEYSAYSGYHAFSRDGLAWTHAALPAFNTTLNFTDGSFVKYGRRERPHLLFNQQGEATHLYTAITIGPGDKTATHVQALGTSPDGDCPCTWQLNMGIHGNDIKNNVVRSHDACCALCGNTAACVAAVFVEESHLCHIKRDTELVGRNGSLACLMTSVV